MDSLTIAGFMSGTSMDGLDCCIAKISIDPNSLFNYNIIAEEINSLTFRKEDFPEEMI